MSGGKLPDFTKIPLLIDGAMGTSLAGKNIPDQYFRNAAGCNEILNRTLPETVTEIHSEFFNAGSGAVETNTFGGSPGKLDVWHLQDESLDLNRRGAAAARLAADATGGLVIGSIGPSGELPSSPGYNGRGVENLTADFAVQAEGLISGGADILLVETSQDILELKCAVRGCRKALALTGEKLEIWATVSLHQGGRMLMGTGIRAALAVGVSLKLDAFGLNCATGPEEMIDAVRFLSEKCPMPIIVSPNAGIPENIDGKACFPMGSERFAELMIPFLNLGVEIIGGCCGSTPEHIRELSRNLDKYKPRSRPKYKFSISSPVDSQDLIPEGSPLIIGERLNSQGSRRFKKMLLAGNYNGMEDIARSQEKGGAQVLDLAVAMTEREGESEEMVRIGRRLSQSVMLPFMVDAVDPEVVTAALTNFPGVPIINSINLENEKRSEQVLEDVAGFGAAVVCMTIDREGMAKTESRKLEIAEKLYVLATGKYKLHPGALLFDPLTFTLATGEKDLKDSAVATLNAIKALRVKYPESGVVLGISNISYGLPVAARRILNAVFLHHAVQSGLTAAIVNPADIKGYHDIPEQFRILAEELIFDKHEDALARFLNELDREPGTAVKQKDQESDQDVLPGELLRRAVLDRIETGLPEIISKCLKEMPAGEILNGILLPAMKEVGDRMARNETILPHVLRSAEIMKKALERLEPHLEKRRTGPAGRILLATVFGDVHDIGKNLVKSILSNNGFDVVDLGKQVPVSRIIEGVTDDEPPLAIGLSALLVSTAMEMKECVRTLHEKGFTVPVIVGGAAVSPAFAKRISHVGDTEYPGGVNYARDAFAGLEICRRLQDGQPGTTVKSERRDGSAPSPAPHTATASSRRNKVKVRSGRRMEVKGSHIFQGSKNPPFTGSAVIALSRDEVMAITEEDVTKDTERKPDEILRDVQRTIGKEDVFRSAAIYGYFETVRNGEKLDVFHGGRSYSFKFPPRRGRSLSGWFNAGDRFIPYLATVGTETVEIYTDLDSRGFLVLSQEWASLCSRLAESSAEAVRRRIARDFELPREWRLPGFSPGYPLWPDLSAQTGLLELLDGERIGLSITRHFQLVPEFSTTGIVILNPDAGY